MNRPSALYSVVSSQRVKGHRLELARWRPTSSAVVSSVFTVRSPSDLALLSSTLAALPQRHKFIIISSYPPVDGLKDLVQEWRRERNQIYVVMINHTISQDQNIDQLPNLDLTFNVLDNVSVLTEVMKVKNFLFYNVNLLKIYLLIATYRDDGEVGSMCLCGKKYPIIVIYRYNVPGSATSTL